MPKCCGFLLERESTQGGKCKEGVTAAKHIHRKQNKNSQIMCVCVCGKEPVTHCVLTQSVAGQETL